MVKIDKVAEHKMVFDQALFPATNEELKDIVGICLDNKIPFAVPVLKKPVEAVSALGDTKFTLN